MCKKLLIGTNVLVPHTKIKLGDKTLTWGIDLGHGLVVNARIESIKEGTWKKHNFNHIASLKIDGFYEQSETSETKFVIPNKQDIGIIHNGTNFLVVTEPSEGIVKQKFKRQPSNFNRMQNQLHNQSNVAAMVDHILQKV